jgi:hypothetical protein
MLKSIAITVCALYNIILAAQSPLPANYHTIFHNSDVVVMHVHYGAHEIVPMHDHPAVATLYVYLNNSGQVDIIHEGPGAVTAHRAPTQTGAMRLAPGIAERHSVQSNSDKPSDFLRVEFQHLNFPELPEAGRRVPAPAGSVPGTHVEFEDPSLRITRIICPTDHPCDPISPPGRSLLIAITNTVLWTGHKSRSMQSGDVAWSQATTYSLAQSSQALLVTILKPDVPGN